MFSKLGEKLAGWFGAQRQEGGGAAHPKGVKPWEDRSVSPAERYQSYYDVVREKCEAIRDAGNRPGVTAAERHKISQDPEANFWVNELRQLKGETPEQFCRRADERVVRALLGKNFLGAEAWQAQGIDVGAAPPLPGAITAALLNSECPLHPGELIKDTHLLVLVPKTVNGEPYSALKLDELCATRKGSGDKLIDVRVSRWKSQPWASAPLPASEWVLLPKSDPDPSEVPEEKHFRDKNIAKQQKVHDDHYKEYREVKTLELMTAVLLNDLVNGEARMLDEWNYLRCIEPNASGGRVSVGRFFEVNGLRVNHDVEDCDNVTIGRALARKL